MSPLKMSLLAVLLMTGSLVLPFTVAIGARFNATNGVNSGHVRVFKFQNPSVLPIETLDFKATPQYSGQPVALEKTVLLTWATQSEQNASHFDIERSSDGKIFDKIGTQAAKRQSSSYRFTDAYPLPILGYYRLKMVDTEDKCQYSKVVSIKWATGLSIHVFPNPMTHEVAITIQSESKKQQIEVFDVLGRLVFNKNTEGAHFLTINTLNWQTGIYFLKVTDGKNVVEQKIVKQ